jgi:hypothetical protein
VVNRLQRSVTRRLNEWRNDQWSATLESFDPEDQSLWSMTKRVMRIPTPSPSLVTPGAIALSDSENAEAVADNLETQFQPVTDTSVPAVIEIVNVELRSYFLTPASEPKLTTPEEVQEAFRDLKFSKAWVERYTEQGLEASPTASGIPSGPDIQRDPPHSSLPFIVEARSGDLYT